MKCLLSFPYQFDFWMGKSTEDQLILTYSVVAAWFDAGLTVYVALLDLSKVFDLVLKSILLGKTRSLSLSCFYWLGSSCFSF